MKILILLLIVVNLCSCADKREIVERLRQNPENTFEDYVKELGEPIETYTDINEYEKPVIERTWFTFLLEESSKIECELDLHEGKKILDFVVNVSFEEPLQVDYGCMKSPKELKKVKEEIFQCVKGRTFTSKKLSGGTAASLTLNSDMSYIYSTSLLGGFASKGTWEIFNGDLESALIILRPPMQQVLSGDVPEVIYVNAYKNCTLKIGETRYH